jgi:hypothetical protein
MKIGGKSRPPPPESLPQKSHIVIDLAGRQAKNCAKMQIIIGAVYRQRLKMWYA